MNHRDTEKLTFELLETWSTFNHYAKESQTFENPEDIHQARIRLRKLITFARLVELTEEPVYLIWKRLMHAFGEVRDLDVQLEATSKKTEIDQLFANHVALQLQGKRSTLIETMHLLISNELDRSVRRFLASPKRYEKKREQFEKVQRKDSPKRIERMHELRLATKAYRYTVEYLRPYTNQPKSAVDRLKTTQTQLGHINDTYQRLERWRSFEVPTAYQAERLHQIKRLEDELRNALDQVEIAHG